MKKLLVTGISGFLGNSIAALDQQEWEVTGLYHNNPVQYPGLKTIQVDLTNEIKVAEVLDKIQPDALIHLAAISNTNYCESNSDISKKVNVEATAHLAKCCKSRAIPAVFTSTDLVFGGTDAPYHEEAKTDPVCVYGVHKAEAEKEVLDIYPEACIARCPVMFGLPGWGNSFMKPWLKNLKEGKPIFAFTDEFRSKVSARTAIEGMLLLLDKKVSGIWHLGGRENISRYDFAVLMTKAFDLPKELVRASKQADVQMAAARPSDVSLDSSKAFALGYNPPLIEEELERLKGEKRLKR